MFPQFFKKVLVSFESWIKARLTATVIDCGKSIMSEPSSVARMEEKRRHLQEMIEIHKS